MSIRQAVFKRSGLLARSTVSPLRSISSSSPRNGGHGHDEHHSAGPDDTETHESWFSRPWRNTFIITALGIVSYPYLPTTATEPISPHLNPEGFAQMKNDPNTPWITRQFARLLEDPKTLKERNDKHVTESMRQAQAKLFLETAERPEINKHLGGGRVFDHASPFGVAVGSQTDVSDVRSL